ncbi:MAG: tRNA (guanosine(37)-N1)-methyltransferase TrmD [Armatimonadetes bacterium]|nr:MAG: tRNA (guanosine(37)-N1)-methyltransferase TrmD [Armatimonadota bacterium]
MKIDFVTLFPETVLAWTDFSILRRAQDAGLIQFGAVNPRDFAKDAHRTVDDSPYGGGPGMVMKPDVLGEALDSVHTEDSFIAFTDPSGELFSQRHAREWSKKSHLVLVCGHYEGIDQRVADEYADAIVSIGDFVLTGGELAAAVIADAVARLVPGVLGSPESLDEDAFADGLLSYPQYTRPPEWKGRRVPEVLQSGDHEAIRRWRRKQRLLATRARRPDLFAKAPLTDEDIDLLRER